MEELGYFHAMHILTWNVLSELEMPLKMMQTTVQCCDEKAQFVKVCAWYVGDFSSFH
jgi:hypothetical protein